VAEEVPVVLGARPDAALLCSSTILIKLYC
jgi:hypothetical protein